MTSTTPTNAEYGSLIREKQADFAKLNIAENPAVVRQKVAGINRLLLEHHGAIKCPITEWETDPGNEVQALLDEAFAGGMVHIEPFQKVKDWVAKWVI